MSTPPSVAVVIPAYNAEAYLTQAIESILSQTFPASEIWIVDDGSTDKTAAIARGYGNKIQLIQHTQAQGSSAARNAALHVTQAPLVAFLDADDIALPKRLEMQANTLIDRPDAAMSFCSMEYIDHQGCKTGDVINADDFGGTGFLGRMMVRNRVGSTSVVTARRSHLLAIGGFDESLSHNEEYALWLKMASTAPVLATEKTLVQYRLHTENISHDRTKQQENETIILGRYTTKKIRDAVQKAYPEEPELSLAFARIMLRRNSHTDAEKALKTLINQDHKDGRTHFFLGNIYLKRSDHKQAQQQYLISLQCNPELAPALNNLGIIEAHNGNHEQAYRLFENAIALKKNYVDAASNLDELKKNDDDLQLHATFTLLRDVLKPRIPRETTNKC